MTEVVSTIPQIMRGATTSTDGASGLVIPPRAGDQNKVLKGDGTWGEISDAGHTIIDGNGNTMPQRRKLKFIKLSVEDDAINDTTIINAASFSFKEWLTSASIDPNKYASLDDVLADEIAVRQLFTIHNSVDYLEENFDNKKQDVYLTILNNDYVAKWVNLRDYALDKLWSVPEIKSIMDTVDKYGYGEWALVGQVPTMTSNTTSYGEASASSVNQAGIQEPYKAFDNDWSTRWWSTGMTDQWIQYKFINPVVVKGISISAPPADGGRLKNFILKASNDNFVNDTHDLYIGVHPGGTINTEYYPIDNDNAYTYYRLFCIDQYSVDGYIAVAELQFYAWAPKGNVPVMTSNTAPYGEASASTVFSNNYAYNAFDNKNNTVWSPSQTSAATNQWIAYKFVNPVIIKRVHLRSNDSYPEGLTYKIEASNDGTNWTALTQNINAVINSGYNEWTDIDNNIPYLMYRLYVVSYTASVGASVRLDELQFYGRELRISVPTMTSNTEPYGVANGTSKLVEDVYDYYVAFAALNRVDKDSRIRGWLPATNDSSPKVYYHFNYPVVPKKLFISVEMTVSETWVIKIIGSNDGTNWETLVNNYSFTSQVVPNYSTAFVLSNSADIPSDNAYKYIGIELVSTTASTGFETGTGIKFNIYGLDYSEYDWDTNRPRKYIYDHGLEFEGLTFWNKDSNNPFYYLKEPDSISVIALNVKNGTGILSTNYIDVSSYNLVRFCMGDDTKMQATPGPAMPILIKDQQPPNGTTLAYTEYAPQIQGPYNGALNISSFNGNYVISLGDGSSATLNERGELVEWWLE